ncbi:MAG: hypothetical protein ACXQTW_05945 [Candidatus Methanospirareceae archaeon]
MVSTEEILCRIEKGGTLDELAAELGMRKSVLVARMYMLTEKGREYIEGVRRDK